MSINYKKIVDGGWWFLLEASWGKKHVLILVEDLIGEDQMIDLIIQSISEEYSDIGFHRLNTYPQHSILEELGILRLPAMVVFNQGAISYISNGALTKSVVREHLA
jgi:hypothetical protein